MLGDKERLRHEVIYRMQQKWMKKAIQLACENVDAGKGGPFGAVVVKDGKIIGQGSNKVTEYNDPTAHAEIMAIREACRTLQSFQLTDCEIYTSCEPCPMCLGAIYWARPKAVYYASSKKDAAAVGFDDDFIYEELALPMEQRRIPMKQIKIENYLLPFTTWAATDNKVEY